MNGPTPMTRLADELGVALPNATGIVTRLVDRGVIERGHDPEDRRVVRVQLTDDGRALIGEMEEARRARMRRLVGALDDAQQRRLIQSVRDLRAAALSLHERDEGTMESAST
jgi:DNA-binding MarR family transcriptional regulator